MQPQYIPTSSRFKDITGQRFGRLVALRPVGKKHSYVLWLCVCDCGNETTAASNLLRRKATQSCGCLLAELRVKRKLTHGLYYHPIRNTWSQIKGRCLNPDHPAYPDYGGRGITICDEWCNDVRAFVDYVSALPHYGEKGYTIDRIDNIKGYEPGNVRWATSQEQALNRRSNRRYTHNGKSLSLEEWNKETGISVGTLNTRINQLNWSVERAVTTPLDTRKRNRLAKN